MSATTRLPVDTTVAGQGHAAHPHVASVAHGGPCVCCLSPSDDRSALLVDVYEAHDALFLKASVPGVLPQDLDIATAGRVVTIRATQPPATRPKGCTTIRRERYAGPWTRVIELPFGVESGAISQTLTRGVLTIRITKPATPPAAAD
jgi:HSP20 family molecular chaperone IbpA